MTYQHRNLTAYVYQVTKPVVIMPTNCSPTTPTTVEHKQGMVAFNIPSHLCVYVWTTTINSTMSVQTTESIIVVFV